jgi:hypothetical protein
LAKEENNASRPDGSRELIAQNDIGPDKNREIVSQLALEPNSDSGASSAGVENWSTGNY